MHSKSREKKKSFFEKNKLRETVLSQNRKGKKQCLFFFPVYADTYFLMHAIREKRICQIRNEKKKREKRKILAAVEEWIWKQRPPKSSTQHSSEKKIDCSSEKKGK